MCLAARSQGLAHVTSCGQLSACGAASMRQHTSSSAGKGHWHFSLSASFRLFQLSEHMHYVCSFKSCSGMACKLRPIVLYRGCTISTVGITLGGSSSADELSRFLSLLNCFGRCVSHFQACRAAQVNSLCMHVHGPIITCSYSCCLTTSCVVRAVTQIGQSDSSDR